MSDSVSEKSEKCEKFEIESDHSDKFDSEKNWKPTSVEEWFESNGRRAKAQQKIKVLNYFNPQALVPQKTADEVIFRHFQGEGFLMRIFW